MATSAELDIIRSSFTASGFHNVYRHRGHRHHGFQVIILGKWVGARKQPREAASLVVQWYRERFGETWPDVFRRRRSGGLLGLKSRSRSGTLAAIRER